MALARELALRGEEVAVLEAEAHVGAGVSSRNSGVIHAGLYYTPGSLKATCCVAGRDMLYAYAAERDIWHQRCGKLVVATRAEEVTALHNLKKNAEANGVTDLRLLSAAEAQKLEPELACVEAILSPSSGMIDVHGLLEAFAADIGNAGGLIQCHARFIAARHETDGFAVEVEGEDKSRYVIRCQHLINAAGLQAQDIARAVEGMKVELIPEQVLGKGNYFFLEGQKAPFERLIYPMPVPGSSGLHCRRDVNGRAVLGPDIEIVDAIDYRVDLARADFFFEAVRRYYPKLLRESLVPDYAGIRPKLKHKHDFVVQGKSEHGIAGLINLFGIESPGLTSCMALARVVADQLR